MKKRFVVSIEFDNEADARGFFVVVAAAQRGGAISAQLEKWLVTGLVAFRTRTLGHLDLTDGATAATTSMMNEATPSQRKTSECVTSQSNMNTTAATMRTRSPSVDLEGRASNEIGPTRPLTIPVGFVRYLVNRSGATPV